MKKMVNSMFGSLAYGYIIARFLLKCKGIIVK